MEQNEQEKTGNQPPQSQADGTTPPPQQEQTAGEEQSPAHPLQKTAVAETRPAVFPPEPAGSAVRPFFKIIAAFLALLPPVFLLLALLLPLPVRKSKNVVIPRGSSIQTIASLLQEGDVPLNAYVFRLAASVFAEDHLQAGEYRISPGQSLVDVVIMMRDGKSVVRLFTVAEGLTSHEVVEMLRGDPALSGEIHEIPEEGSLLPETYRYSYGDDRAVLVERMKKSMNGEISELWNNRAPDLPYKDMKEAVTMASIIEKETGKKAEERPRVAGVFINRLKQGMRLQSDPTVIYALTKGQKSLGRNLTREDLAFDSPYNTYLYAGLPPGPISNPGRASLEAALHPEKNDFLYFVADGTGGHAFSKDLPSHNKNVNRWIGMTKKR